MLEKAQSIKDYIIKARRDIHQHPELGYQEVATSNYVADRLEELGVTYKTGVARTGIIAEIKKGEGPTVLLRADMDALPIQENTGLAFASKIPGVMHACGHDTHTAMLLGAINLLRDASFNGTLRFLFQPAEEGNYDDPDGFSGAQRVILEGALDDVDAAIGLHQIPTMATGTIAITPGSVLAAADFFKIVVNGRSTHAGVSPEKGIDAVVIASELILSMQTIVSRKVNPKDTAVVSVCTIEGGSAANIIAEKVCLTGTIRSLKESTRATIVALMQARCDAFAAMHNTSIDLHFYYSVPVTVNDETISRITTGVANKLIGPENVLNDVTIMGGEDFAYIAQRVPSCFALLGTRVAEGEAHPLHSPKMLINEQALPLGSAYLAQAALELVSQL